MSQLNEGYKTLLNLDKINVRYIFTHNENINQNIMTIFTNY